jgi:hypothetical protein
MTKLKARVGCSPQAEALELRSNDGGARVRRGDGGRLRLRKKCSGERGPDTTGRERAHRRVSRAADSKTELIVALYGARARRWPRNKQWASAGSGGAPCSRGQSERERARELGRGCK